MFDLKKEQFTVLKYLKKIFLKTDTYDFKKYDMAILGIEASHFFSIIISLSEKHALVMERSLMQTGQDLYVVNYDHLIEETDVIEVAKGKNFEKVYKSLQRTVGIKNKKEALVKSRAFKLPKNFDWVDIKFVFKDEFTLQVYYKGRYLGEMSNEDIGCYKKNSSDKKYDKQWLFLLKMSAYSVSIYSSKDKDAEKNRQTKKKVSDRLKMFFETDESPFKEHSWTNEYKLKFEIEPPPEIRNNKELHGVKDV